MFNLEDNAPLPASEPFSLPKMLSTTTVFLLAAPLACVRGVDGSSARNTLRHAHFPNPLLFIAEPMATQLSGEHFLAVELL
jgi:hypothetical protein